MKFMVLLIIPFCLTGAQVAGQHPLVGTWEMVSVKGIDADGEPFFYDTASVKETKIITPTHYMLIAWDVEGDSLIFNRTMAGQVTLEKEKYIEFPTHASVQIFENVKVDFTWKLAGNIFTQSGTIVRPDGKTVVLEALIFHRVMDVKPHPKNPAIGTLNQVSSSYTTSDGKNNSTFNESDSRLLIVTPTHWMRMDYKNKKFGGALYGTYSMKGETVFTTLDFSTYPSKKGDRHEFRQKVNGNKIQITSTGTSPEGKPATFHDVLEKAQ